MRQRLLKSLRNLENRDRGRWHLSMLGLHMLLSIMLLHFSMYVFLESRSSIFCWK